MRFAYGTGEDFVQEKALYKEKEIKVTSSQIMQSTKYQQEAESHAR